MKARQMRPQSEQKRNAILEAAAHAIAEHGFHGMSMRELARETGQALASFYNYFRSKDEVIFHIQAGAFEQMIRTAEDALRGLTSPQDRLFAFIYQHVRFVAEHPDVMRVLVHEAGAVAPARRNQVRAIKERYYDLGRGIVGELFREGCGAEDAAGDKASALELERVTYGVFGMLNWIYGWYDPARHGSPGEVARSLHGLALCGLVAKCPNGVTRTQETLERKFSVVPSAPLIGARRSSP
jgi:AcrR family transcriptional regulator